MLPLNCLNMQHGLSRTVVISTAFPTDFSKPNKKFSRFKFVHFGNNSAFEEIFFQLSREIKNICELYTREFKNNKSNFFSNI